MENKSSTLLKEGRKFIDPIMEANGFHWVPGPAGNSSGGNFDSGEYVKSDRRLELHFRYSLGLITYRIGSNSLIHEDYMRHVARAGENKYPGFSSDPLDGFKHLASDLKIFCSDFLSGSGLEYQAAVTESKEREKLPGFQKLSE